MDPSRGERRPADSEPGDDGHDGHDRVDGVDAAGPDHGVDLVAYVEGRARAADQRAVEAHLRRCRACDDAVAELRTTLIWLDLVRAERAAEASDAVDVADPGDQ